MGHIKIKNENVDFLHCGACQEKYNNVDDLKKHIETCPSALTILPMIHEVWAGSDKTGHTIAGAIQLMHQNSILIKRYAYSIADDLDTWSRSKIHRELCEKLNINYAKFKPFESSKIKKSLTRYEAEFLLLKELKTELTA